MMALYDEKPESFEHPGSEYRGAPFWAWNCKLDARAIVSQVGQFKSMGMGGFFIHTRVGLDTEYLGAEFMDAVEACLREAKAEGLQCWLYDEDRWPSGYGGGLVTTEERFKSRYIVLTPYRRGTREHRDARFDSCASVQPNGRGEFLAAFQVRLGEKGELEAYTRCGEDDSEAPGRTKWYAYREIAAESPWFNGSSYVDTLNPEAVARFIQVTHERYRAKLGRDFGTAIPGIFTDEPQFPHKGCLATARSLQEVVFPYTDDLPESFRAAYGEELLDRLPELLWDLPGGEASAARYHYHDHLAERFASSYGDQIGAWCERQGLLLCGHMMEEPTLGSQTRAIGEVMRGLRGFGMPGIDILCDQREYSTAKQAQSVAHQYDRAGVVGEIYGVTNWDFDFRRHKLQGDWLAALGVTKRVPHLTWLSMAGEAKRDYPASIGRQSPWFDKYPLIEDHFARVNSVLSRGKPLVRIGVIHPVESYWLKFGPNRETGDEREEMEREFRDITEWLLFGLQDFDYVSEASLPKLATRSAVGAMEYDAIVVPGCLTLRSSTLALLRSMGAEGKRVVFLGSMPKYIDAKPALPETWLGLGFELIPFRKANVLKSLEPYRLIDIRYDGPRRLKKPNHKKDWNGERPPKFVYQMRIEGDLRWLFIANAKADDNVDSTSADDVAIELHGDWDVLELDTMSGRTIERQTSSEGGRTMLKARIYEHDSLLLRLSPRKAKAPLPLPAAAIGRSEGVEIDVSLLPVRIELEEPNVLVLDMPEFKYGEGLWAQSEEILRIDNALRDVEGFPRRRAALAQPWTYADEPGSAVREVWLKYSFDSELALEGTSLALEGARAARVSVNGIEVSSSPAGWYVDPSIELLPLPRLSEGRNEIVVCMPFSRKTNLEACFLLGDFRVELSGRKARLLAPGGCGYWGSLTRQGCPFYGGSARYSVPIELGHGRYEIQATKFRAPLLEARLDGAALGEIAFSPYSLRFDVASSGLHTLTLISFGSRVNTFGAIHDCDEREVYFDPEAWRTESDGWAYEYQLKETGLLKSPLVRRL